MAGLGEALRTGRLVVVSFQDISGTSLSSPHSHVSDASGAADGVATCAGQPECAKDGKLVQKNGSSGFLRDVHSFSAFGGRPSG